MQTYTPALGTMGNPQMEPVGNGDWIKAEDHAAALATARDDALREAIEVVTVLFDTTDDGDEVRACEAFVLADEAVTILTAMIGQPAPPREVTVQELAASPLVEALVKAVEWYQEQARLCRLVHSEGDKGRRALSADGGDMGRTALRALKGDE